MAKRVKQRQCLRCGTMNNGDNPRCTSCGTGLIKRRFKMGVKHVRLLRTLCSRKGVVGELYDMRLAAYGLGSCKEIKKQEQFDQFINDLKTLPDA